MHRMILSHCSAVLSVHIFFFMDPPTTQIYTLSLHDALPISWALPASTRSAGSSPYAPATRSRRAAKCSRSGRRRANRSEEHTSELQSHSDLVCRLLLEKKKKKRETSNKP